jgi:3-deoxy-manno-octulosonate cytidylyltransferase (CMP-KDO synthetase)
VDPKLNVSKRPKPGNRNTVLSECEKHRALKKELSDSCRISLTSMKRVAAVIPVRMGSSRFPGKPLAALHGLPIVEHVFRRAQRCTRLDAVYIATCDYEIRDVAEGFGATVIMTSPMHQRATDRVAEAAEHFDSDVIVMIQGDEPMITPEMVATSLSPLLSDPSIGCVNLAHRITSQRELLDPNTIKVVADLNDNALYFSRSPIPKINVEESPAKAFKQVCLIPFTRECLLEFARLPPTPLEVAESIDMLRLLEHGRRVRLVETQVTTHAVDTPADLQLVETLMNEDPLIRRGATPWAP